MINRLNDFYFVKRFLKLQEHYDVEAKGFVEDYELIYFMG